MSYGEIQYGSTGYSQDLVNESEIKKYYIDLTKYVPEHIWKCPQTQEVFQAQGYQIGGLNYYMQDLVNQCFIDTATWGLDIWEAEFGIVTNLTYSYEQRREILKAKKRGQGTVTVAMIKNMAEAFSGGEVNVIEHNEDYYFTIQFVGVKGIPRNMQSFIDTIENIKPAHLNYEFKYTYTVWNFLKEKNLSWNGANIETWNELKVYE